MAIDDALMYRIFPWGKSAEDIYRELKGGAGSGSLYEAQGNASDDQRFQLEIEDEIRNLQTTLESGWTGDSADAANQSSMPLVEHARIAGDRLRDTESSYGNQAAWYDWAEREVKEVPENPDDQSLLGKGKDWVTGDLDDKQKAYDGAVDVNTDVYDKYFGASSGNGESIPERFPELSSDMSELKVDTKESSGGHEPGPGSVQVNDSGGTGGPAYRSSPSGPSGTTESPELTSPTGPDATAPTRSGGPDSAGGLQPPRTSGVGDLPAATNPSGYGPGSHTPGQFGPGGGGGGGSTAGTGAGFVPPMAGGMAGTGGGDTPRAGGGGSGGRGGFGPGARGGGAMGGGAGGAGGGAGSGAIKPGPGAMGGAGGATAGGAGSPMGAGARGGGPMGGMMGGAGAGRGGKGEDDQEHGMREELKQYWDTQQEFELTPEVNEYGEAVRDEDGNIVPPPVIGE